MKQYLSPDQTSKLIELGFKKPKSISGYCQRGPYEYDAETNTKMVVYDDTQYPIYAYSIGELIEMLPEAICESKEDDYHYFLSIETDSLIWKVFYESEDEVTLCSTFGVELIDALCSMLTILKRQGTL